MTGVITDIHFTEPIGTVRVIMRLRHKDEPQPKDVVVELMWPPLERNESYKSDCGCREVYAVANGDQVRAAFGLPKAEEQRFVCACFFVKTLCISERGRVPRRR